jgi:hypothetical protein
MVPSPSYTIQFQADVIPEKRWAMCPETETPCSVCPTNRVPCEAAQADACRVPQGFKLVPVHPTEQMLDAAKKETWIGQHYASKCWAAMLSAAPTPTKGEHA